VRDLLWAEAVLGKDAEEFLNTELGRYMLGRCEQEIQEAQDELSRVSSWRRRRIQEWLAELISNGKSAEAALEETE
jgi:hypothetical protein